MTVKKKVPQQAIDFLSENLPGEKFQGLMADIQAKASTAAQRGVAFKDSLQEEEAVDEQLVQAEGEGQSAFTDAQKSEVQELAMGIVNHLVTEYLYPTRDVIKSLAEKITSLEAQLADAQATIAETKSILADENTPERSMQWLNSYPIRNEKAKVGEGDELAHRKPAEKSAEEDGSKSHTGNALVDGWLTFDLSSLANKR
jgi:paraquat-inducible protein B